MIKRKFYLSHFRKLAMFVDIASESFCDVSRWSAEGGQCLVCAAAQPNISLFIALKANSGEYSKHTKLGRVYLVNKNIIFFYSLDEGGEIEIKQKTWSKIKLYKFGLW